MPTAKSRNRPNVLVILSDQHNIKALGHMGHPDVRTPHLDKLAAEGVRFTSAVTQNPICTPSRVSWLSGQYCHNHGYYALSGPNPGGLPTILGHFRRHGYRTSAVGKIHCPEYWVEDDTDHFRDTCGTSIGGRSKEYARYLEERGLTDLEDHGALNEFGAAGQQTVEGRPSKVSYEDGQEGWIVRDTMRFIDETRAAGAPFFAFVSLPKPHQCYTPAQQFWDLYDEEKLTLPPNADYDMSGKAPHLRQTAESWKTRPWQLFEPKTFEAGRLRKLHGYLGNVSHVDHAVGELTAYLEAAGLAEDTIVVYSADHGDYACEHGVMEKAPGICSDAITRVPFIWRFPSRLPANHECTQIAEAVDVAPTLCELAGLPVLETADGRSIVGLLEGGDDPVHRIGVTEFFYSKSVRRGDYRYVHYPPEMFPDEHPDGFCELYNLVEDPWEMDNLALKPQFREKVEEMRAELLNWLITSTRPTTVNPLPAVMTEQRVERYHHTVNKDNRINPERVHELTHRNYL